MANTNKQTLQDVLILYKKYRISHRGEYKIGKSATPEVKISIVRLRGLPS